MTRAWLSPWRGPTGVTFRQCLRASSAATAIAIVVAILANATSRPTLIDGNSAAASTPWLTLPLLVVAVACCLTAAQTWPTFALGQPGSETVRRLERGPCGGRFAVIAGALLAQLALSIPIALLLTLWFDAPRMASRHHQVTGPALPYLEQTNSSVTFDINNAPMIAALWLRPRAGMPTGPGATDIAITANNKLLTTTPVAFSESGQLLRVAIEPQRLSQFTVTRTGGDVPLFFGSGSVIAVGPANLPTWLNSLVAVMIATWTSTITLAIAALIGTGTAWPTLATTICCAQFVQWIGGMGQIDEALLALMRGQWLL